MFIFLVFGLSVQYPPLTSPAAVCWLAHNLYDLTEKDYEWDKFINSCITHEVIICLAKVNLEFLAI